MLKYSSCGNCGHRVIKALFDAAEIDVEYCFPYQRELALRGQPAIAVSVAKPRASEAKREKKAGGFGFRKHRCR